MKQRIRRAARQAAERADRWLRLPVWLTRLSVVAANRLYGGGRWHVVVGYISVAAALNVLEITRYGFRVFDLTSMAMLGLQAAVVTHHMEQRQAIVSGIDDEMPDELLHRLIMTSTWWAGVAAAALELAGSGTAYNLATPAVAMAVLAGINCQDDDSDGEPLTHRVADWLSTRAPAPNPAVEPPARSRDLAGR